MRVLDGRVFTLGGQVAISPVFAVLLGRPVRPGDPPGAVWQAFAATFAGLEIGGEGVVLGNRVVDPGPVTLWTSPAGEYALQCGPEDFGDLATEVGKLTLAAGELVIAPARAVPFDPPGVVQLWGPGEAVLTVRFDVPEV